MKESYLFDMTFNNVVFAARNKSYGAYELRKDYSKHMMAGALIATSLFAVGLGWPLLMPVQEKSIATIETPAKDDGRVVIEEWILPPPPESDPEPKQQAAIPVTQEQIKTVKNITTIVVPDTHPGPDEAPPTEEEMTGAIIGTQNIDGELLSNLNLTDLEGEGSNGTTGTGNNENNNIVDFAEEMPSFEGGEAALMRHISKKIRYPRQAITEQIEGMVIVSFVVNRNGKVTDATVLKGLGYGTDEEALRVIQSLPDWTPGKQNGKPVAVRYTLPIRFNLQR
ncbi:energy transducer TonB [Pontibacter sp. HSC-36F09]|uniref:energy transducer TonB n=1 Tax=Pontibacter sp. HSC-36F09 TaxID=2910966 RepID=UPI0020A13E08|nr:energy transducer TonB [Pontibacter sp. HSC-36F09]MCP2045660.1 protein TonB [Pontibacter sp. HSC-36F09]